MAVTDSLAAVPNTMLWLAGWVAMKGGGLTTELVTLRVRAELTTVPPAFVTETPYGAAVGQLEIGERKRGTGRTCDGCSGLAPLVGEA